ncbi:MAG: undecaprenyl-diphosphatase UppP [Ignavibacteria bacterium]|nr:undecaprenyl-diphosphatase UppP [Ignavibacteria bacterium]MCU7502623.1 undecaprenyl-diphosphatase UppP [Ignavibacteria bacterium]MCU7515174.1 undecaprenyl-diphosphatase UppP [Ignavibacteria bacterium]
MNIIEAVILGIIQGLSEFLPISSTAHLTLAGKLMVGQMIEDYPERWTAFMAVIQLGTLLAVLVYFRKDIMHIILEFLKDNLTQRKKFSEQSLNSRLGWYIIIGTIPVVLIGLGFKDFIEGALTKNLVVISFSLIVLGILLAVAEKVSTFRKDINQVSWLDSLIVGLAQSLALIPGSSRSGTTITAGLFLGFTRETAARFSFLLSIPAVLASGLLEFKESLPYLDKSASVNLVLGTLAAFIFGYLSIDFLLKFLRKNSTFIFVFYRIILGVVILGLIGFNIIQP